MRKIDNIHIKSLINDLKIDGIAFSFDGETTKRRRDDKVIVLRLENVVFSKDDKIFKLCEPIFFREYGNISDNKSYYSYLKGIILKGLK